MPKTLLQRVHALSRCLRFDAAVYFSAIVSSLIPLLALGAWAGHSSWLVRTNGATMLADAALFCLAGGLGLVGAMRQRFAISRCIGIAIAAAANLHLTADVAGFSVSVHRLVPTITARVLGPAPICNFELSPVTSVSFFLVGCALTLMHRRVSHQVLAITAAMGVVIASIGTIVLCGYTERSFCGMPAATAVCVAALGVGVCAFCFTDRQIVREELSPSSIVIGVIGLVLIFGGTDVATIVKTRAAVLSASSVDQSYAELRAANRVADLIRTAETSARVFAITRREEFLAAYLATRIALLSAAGAQDLQAVSQWRERKLADSIQQRISQLDDLMRTDRAALNRGSVRSEQDSSGSVLSDQIGADLASVTASIESEAENRKSQRQVMMENLLDIVVFSYGIAVLLAAATVLLARIEAKQHEKTSMRSAVSEVLEPSTSVQALALDCDGERPKHLLLIEDNEEMMLLVEHALFTHGGGKYRLTWADSLKQGFRTLTSGGVDIVLLDLGLPEASGMISYACVRGCAPEVPVMVMTGDDCRETEEMIVAAGVDDFLVKQQLSGSRLVSALDAVFKNGERPPQVNFSKAQCQ